MEILEKVVRLVREVFVSVLRPGSSAVMKEASA